jgi:hypothetical protein
MHEHSEWKSVYYDALSSRNLPLGTILLVMTAHYACCVGVTKHGIGSGREMFVGTPFHHLRRNIKSCVNTSIENDTTPEKLGIRDPISFIYDSCMILIREKNDTPNVPNVTGVCNVTSDTDEVDDHSGMIQVCVLHAISLGSFIALWLPTTYSNFSTKSSALWTIGSISVCCSFASWSLCMFIYTFDVLRKLSICLSVHLTMQLLNAQCFLADKDPSVPIYMPIWVARGVNVAQGMLLCYIIYSEGSISEFDTTQFYMNHVWAVGISELVKQFIIGPIVLLVGMTVRTKMKYA